MKKIKLNSTNEISIKNNDEISLSKIINSEVNLLRSPFFVLARKNKILEIEYREITERGGLKKERVWNVSANPKYGYPGPFDREVHKAIEQIISEILREKKEIENPILFSIYDLCNRMGVSFKDGGNFKRVRSSFEKIRATTIKSENAFYYKGKKKWISKVFGLYDGVIFRGEQLEDGSITETNLLYLSDIYLESLNSHYTKSIDYTYWQSLESKIASRLYEILGVMFYGIRNKKEDFIRFKYSTLCQLLPVIPYRYISSAKQQLDPSNNELRDTGFISKFDWNENGNKDWLIYYWPGERAKEEIKRAKIKSIDDRTEEYLPGLKEEVKIFSEEQAELVNKLLELNVSKVTAENLIKNNNQELIEKWIEAINYANADDKAAYLVKAIRENWQFPEEYLRERKEEEQKEERGKIEVIKVKKQEEKNKKRQEEIKKIEQIYNSLDPLQQEEIKTEIENRLPEFWKVQLNKERIKGKTSKMLEVVLEEKRREIIKEWINSGRIEGINSK
ncbi:MAG: replication initiator protein A [Actinobacteria bacterium]|nr:replication initiator protein A [Actinomycetota bacterium]